MAAKDYEICTGLAGAYIAKKDKDGHYRDKRLITESEILALIHWYSKKAKSQMIYHDGKEVALLTRVED